MLLNDAAPTLPLDGRWSFSLAGSPSRDIDVPSAWEPAARDLITDGPAAYRRSFSLPASWRRAGRRVLLEFDAVSLVCVVRVNGRAAGEHAGAWSPFQFDVTDSVRAGDNTIEVEVWKPGPRFPPRAWLAGFLPDACTTFGGIWQSTRLRSVRGPAVSRLRLAADRRGRLLLDVSIAGGSGERPSIALLDARRRTVAHLEPRPAAGAGRWSAIARLPGATPWSPETPTLHEAVIELPGLRVARRIGFRTMAARGDTVMLNGRARHLRGVLDWGWQPEGIAPAFTRAEARERIARARALGFNLIKLCLFVPNEAVFDVADELGMPLWLELPMWLPEVSEPFKRFALAEYAAVLRRVHHHPSIVLASLGCELGAQVDTEFLAQLRALARAWLPGALLCDNSGSAEAYGGAATDASDFHDYHFYADPHFFQPLVDHFSAGRPREKPWIFGEYADADTVRDYALLSPERHLWLTVPAPAHAHTWLADAIREGSQRLRVAGMADGGARITRIARAQATEVRKFVVERTRAASPAGGYVVTGWMDTPIATSGVVDDRGVLKFDPAEWQRFNADRVLLLDRPPRRRWLHGGDRPLQRDPFVFRSGEPLDLRLSLANGGAAVRAATLVWRAVDDAGRAAGQGSRPIGALAEGRNTPLGALTLSPSADDGDSVRQIELSAWLRDASGAELSANTWRLWVVSGADVAALRWVERVDDAVLGRVRAGGEEVAWLSEPDERFCARAPFWREAVHVFEPHAIWRGMPPADHADMRFFAVATDIALDSDALARTLGVARSHITPMWRRFDARMLTWSDYAVEASIGRGRLSVTTLQFAGGAGAQPAGLEDNPMGAWLLSRLAAPHHERLR